MKTTKNLVAIATLMAMCINQVQGQEYYDETTPEPSNVEAAASVEADCIEADCGEAYCDSGCASYMSAALPIGALAVAAIIIATTNNRHHHRHSSSSNSSSSFSHASSLSPTYYSGN